MPKPPSATAVHRHCRLLLAAGILAFLPLAPAVLAQPAMQSIANTNSLPLRNVQIEVRQVQSRNRGHSGAQADARLQFESGGSVSAQGRLGLGQQQEQLSGTSTQMALVLNGRSTGIALRSSTPFRLMQTQFHNGRPVLVQGTVLLEASTGFTATPRWDGSDQLELEIAASQAGLQSGMLGVPVTPSSSSASSLVLPLGEWVTVAQSASDSSGSRNALLGQGSETEQFSSELQVRVTVR